MVFNRTPRGNTLILLSAVLISFGLLFVTSASAFIFAGIGLFMYYYVSRLLLEVKAKAISNLEVTRECPGRVVEGGEVPVGLVMVNRTVARLSLEVMDVYPPFLRMKDGFNAAVVNVPARGYSRLTYTLTPTSVGEQEFGPLRLVLRDAAGLFFYEREVEVKTAVEVTPRVKELAKGSLAAVAVSNYGGALVSARKGEGMEFAEIREYARGDPFRRIEWRSSARTGHLMVRDFYAETQLNVMVLLDATATMAYGQAGETKLDYASRSVAALFSYLARRGDFMGITVADGSPAPVVIPLARGGDQLTRLMRLLGRLKPGPPSEGALGVGVRRALGLGGVRGRTLFFAISDLESKSALVPLKQLLAMRHEVVVMSPFTPLFESHGISGLDRMVYSIRTSHSYRERGLLVKEAAKLGVTVLDVGPKDLFPKLILRVEELRRKGGS